jgi:hypothetical protein
MLKYAYMKPLEKSVGKHLSDIFPIQNDLKQGDALLPLLFNFALLLAIMKVKESWVGLKVNGTRHLLGFADVNLLGDKISTIMEIQNLQYALLRRLI